MKGSARGMETSSGADEERGAGGDVDSGSLWEALQSSFSEVQALLEKNQVLIKEINLNHESQSAESLIRNVGLIKELNSNIALIVELYAGLSSGFLSSLFKGGGGGGGEAEVDRQVSQQNAMVLLQKKPRQN